MGVTLDAISFFWNMAIGSISLIILLWNYILSYQNDEKLVENVDKVKESIESKLPNPMQVIVQEKEK